MWSISQNINKTRIGWNDERQRQVKPNLLMKILHTSRANDTDKF